LFGNFVRPSFLLIEGRGHLSSVLKVTMSLLLKVCLNVEANFFGRSADERDIPLEQVSELDLAF
jgi:hypothetical protein